MHPLRCPCRLLYLNPSRHDGATLPMCLAQGQASELWSCLGDISSKDLVKFMDAEVIYQRPHFFYWVSMTNLWHNVCY